MKGSGNRKWEEMDCKPGFGTWDLRKGAGHLVRGKRREDRIAREGEKDLNKIQVKLRDCR